MSPCIKILGTLETNIRKVFIILNNLCWLGSSLGTLGCHINYKHRILKQSNFMFISFCWRKQVIQRKRRRLCSLWKAAASGHACETRYLWLVHTWSGRSHAAFGLPPAHRPSSWNQRAVNRCKAYSTQLITYIDRTNPSPMFFFCVDTKNMW